MEENTQEKNLIEKNEKSIFGRIKKFFKKLFNKKENAVENETVEENSASVKENNEFKE